MLVYPPLFDVTIVHVVVLFSGFIRGVERDEIASQTVKGNIDVNLQSFRVGHRLMNTERIYSQFAHDFRRLVVIEIGFDFDLDFAFDFDFVCFDLVLMSVSICFDHFFPSGTLDCCCLRLDCCCLRLGIIIIFNVNYRELISNRLNY